MHLLQEDTAMAMLGSLSQERSTRNKWSFYPGKSGQKGRPASLGQAAAAEPERKGDQLVILATIPWVY